MAHCQVQVYLRMHVCTPSEDEASVESEENYNRNAGVIITSDFEFVILDHLPELIVSSLDFL